MYRVQDVEAILDIARPTIYELARRDPELLGAVRFGRLVRFRREVVDGLATGKRV
jgi:excisionase family DNA binding protein